MAKDGAFERFQFQQQLVVRTPLTATITSIHSRFDMRVFCLLLGRFETVDCKWKINVSFPLSRLN